MTVALAETPILQFLNNAGQLNAGGTLLTQVGGVNYPTYQDSAGLTALPNPIPLNSRGEVSNASGTSVQLFLLPGVAYTFTLFDVNGNQLWQAVDVMAIAPAAVGNMTDEKGGGGGFGFAAGTDFTAGTSTTLTLSQNYGSASNLWVAFDGVEQGADTFTLGGTGNKVLTFNAAIPLGTNKVYVKGGTALTVGTPGTGTVTDATIAASSKVATRSAMWFDVKDPQFGAKGNGTTDDTVAIQLAINAAMTVGGTVYFSPGTYLCGSLTVNTSNGGAIFAIPRTAKLVPNAVNVTFFTLTNSLNQIPFTIEGITFSNAGLLTGCTGISGQNLYQFSLKNICVVQMGYVVNLTSSAPATQAFNVSIDGVVQYGSGSFSFAGVGSGAGAARYYDVHISNVTQFTTGGDTWSAPWFTFTRVITALMTNVHGQSMSGNAIGVHIVGQCEGIFLNNVVIPYSASGIVADVTNGDTILPSWIYLNNVGVDQFTTHGIDMSANYLRISNANITGGATRHNTGSGLLMRANCIDYTVEGTQIQGMWNDGLTVLSGASTGRFMGCSFNGNAQSGSGWDVDIVALTPIDPLFQGCQVGTKNLNSSALLNGGSTSRYINSQRLQVASNGTSNQVLATYTVPANTLVDGKTLSIKASGSLASNANARTVLVQVAGVTVASFSISSGGVAWKALAECLRVDSNNVWLLGETIVGATPGVSSTIQTPFNSAVAFTVQLLTTTVAASDVLMHHFDVELIN